MGRGAGGVKIDERASEYAFGGHTEEFKRNGRMYLEAYLDD